MLKIFIKLFKKKSWFIPGVMLLVINSAFSQIILGNQVAEDEVSEVPKIENLTIKWWQYFEEAENVETFSKRVDLFISGIESVKNTEEAADIPVSTDNIKKLFNEYMKQKYSEHVSQKSKQQAPLENYSLASLLDMNKQISELKQQIEKTEEEKESVKSTALDTDALIEKQKINYFNLSNDLNTKVQSGIDWVVLRIKKALVNLSVERLNVKLAGLNKKLEDDQTNLSLSSSKLVIKEGTTTDIDRDEINKKLKKAEAKIDNLSIKLTSGYEDTQESRLNNDLIKLDLTLALIDSDKNKLILNKDKLLGILVLLYSENKTDLTAVRKLLASTEQYINEINTSVEDWQKLSLKMLLGSIADQGTSRKILQLDKKKREKAQQIIKDYETLKIFRDDNVFILSLVKQKLKEVDTGFSKTWSVIKDFIISAKNNVVAFIYKPIFTINEYPVTLLPLIKLLLIIFIGYLVSKTVTFFMVRIEKRLKLDKLDNRSSLYLMHRLIHYLIIFIAVISGFSVLGLNLGNITLIAGALSVGIGFGLQNLVSNFVSGLTIMFERTLSVGDYIELDGKTTGMVKEIRARSTRINTNDNIDIIIPNSEMVSNKIVNWTLKESVRRIKIPFGVAYGTDKELVRKAALEAASNVQYTLNNIQGKEPEVWLNEFGDSSVNYLLLVWVAHYGLRRPNRIRSYYNWELDSALHKYGIEIPFPQRDVHLNIVKKKPKEDALNKDMAATENDAET